MTRTVFRNANLLDGDQPARARVAVVVEGERITAVAGPGDPPVAPARPGDRDVDLAGRTLLPGLILSHYHSTYRDITIMPEPLGIEKPPGYLMLVAADNARRALHAGFTGILSAGVVNTTSTRSRARDREGVVPGPRLVPGGLALTRPALTTTPAKYWWSLAPRRTAFRDGPTSSAGVRSDQARRADHQDLRERRSRRRAEDASTRLAPDERAIVAAAHQRGCRCARGATGSEGARASRSSTGDGSARSA
jgi:imidazolonepropionase-like amidohydrolase